MNKMLDAIEFENVLACARILYRTQVSFSSFSANNEFLKFMEPNMTIVWFYKTRIGIYIHSFCSSIIFVTAKDLFSMVGF